MGRFEAVLLTGGRSSRMGRDKAALLLNGTTLAQRIATVVLNAGLELTVLGPSFGVAASTLADFEPYSGPLAALSRFDPKADGIIVLSCDLVRFELRLLEALMAGLDREACVPVVDGFAQPLCAAYSAAAFGHIPEVLASGGRSMMAWLDRLDWAPLDLASHGIDPRSAIGVNSPAELTAFQFS